MVMSLDQKRVLVTIVYRLIFKSVYTPYFYFNWLIHASNRNSRLSYARFIKIYDDLIISLQFPLHSTQTNDIYELKYQRAIKVAQLMSKIPSIKMIAITGSVASEKPKESDDIDLMVVTCSDTLWTTRLMIILLLEIFRIRRRPNDVEFQDKICVNLLLDINNIQIPSNKRNLYVAHELLHAVPVFDRDETYRMYLVRNSWVKYFLPRIYNLNLARCLKIASCNNKFGFLIPVIALFEPVVYNISCLVMSPIKGKERINRNYAFFHPRDYQLDIETSFQKALSSYKIDYHEFFFINKKLKRSSRR